MYDSKSREHALFKTCMITCAKANDACMPFYGCKENAPKVREHVLLYVPLERAYVLDY